MKRLSSNKEINRFVAECEAKGWEAFKTSGGHIRLRHRSGDGLVHVPSTTRYPHAVAQSRAQVRRIERGVSHDQSWV